MSVLGYVQAGGGSTRFGRDKALVEFAGKSLLECTCELAGSVCETVYVVAPERKYVNPPAPLLVDRWPGQGPLGGILTALHHLSTASDGVTGHALIVSCDMPFLTREWLAFLVERATGSKAQVVFPESENGWEPLCACWRDEATGAVQAAFDAGVRKMTEAMKRLTMEVLDEPVWKRFDTDGRLFWNMNTPEDYEEARRIFEDRASEQA